MKDKDKQDLQKQINDSGLIIESLEKKVENLSLKIRQLILGKEIDDTEDKEILKRFDKLDKFIKLHLTSEALIKGVNNACDEFNKKRYLMCKDQPAQIDCRITSCKWHKDGSCHNISPAIKLNDNLSANCYSFDNPNRTYATGGIVPQDNLINELQNLINKDSVLFTSVQNLFNKHNNMDLIKDIEDIKNKGYVHYTTIDAILNKYK